MAEIDKAREQKIAQLLKEADEHRVSKLLSIEETKKYQK